MDHFKKNRRKLFNVSENSAPFEYYPKVSGEDKTTVSHLKNITRAIPCQNFAYPFCFSAKYSCI